MKALFLRVIAFYQKYISPYKPRVCRFYPTCSQYAYTAIERYGAIRGGGMALWRLLKCNPFHPGGIDEVPEKKTDE